MHPKELRTDHISHVGLSVQFHGHVTEPYKLIDEMKEWLASRLDQNFVSKIDIDIIQWSIR